jgi:hypothetical protein
MWVPELKFSHGTGIFNEYELYNNRFLTLKFSLDATVGLQERCLT